MATEKPAAQKKKISNESALAQFDAWLEYYGLDFDDIVVQDGKESAETMKNTLIRAIVRLELEISVEGELSVIQHLKHPTANTTDIEYKDKVARARIAMGDGNNSESNRYAFMGALCGLPVVDLLKLKGSDMTIFSRLATVFSLV